jgi:hypothetical protein
MTSSRLIRCCGCGGEKVSARLTDGKEIYPHRPDLAALPFWKCDACGNYVGCHHETGKPTEPLGNIPTAELRKARKHIHAILDSLWKSKRFRRKELYGIISDHMGFGYHTAQLRTIEEARSVYRFVKELAA